MLPQYYRMIAPNIRPCGLACVRLPGYRHVAGADSLIGERLLPMADSRRKERAPLALSCGAVGPYGRLPRRAIADTVNEHSAWPTSPTAALGSVADMDIRDAAVQDLPAIVALYTDDELGSRREGPAEPLDAAYLDAFAAIQDDPNARVVVLADGGEVVGTLQLNLIPHLVLRGGRRAQVEAVRIASSRRGEGLGERLVRWAITEAERHGCRLIQLTTNARRSEAHRFYERLGFTASHVGMKRHLQESVNGREVPTASGS